MYYEWEKVKSTGSARLLGQTQLGHLEVSCRKIKINNIEIFYIEMKVYSMSEL